jgi:hypothetical protein
MEFAFAARAKLKKLSCGWSECWVQGKGCPHLDYLTHLNRGSLAVAHVRLCGPVLSFPNTSMIAISLLTIWCLGH